MAHLVSLLQGYYNWRNTRHNIRHIKHYHKLQRYVFNTRYLIIKQLLASEFLTSSNFWEHE